MALPLLGLGALAAAPWLIRSAPGIARGAKTMWDLGRGLGTAGGRSRAAQAAWGAGRPAHTTLAAQAPRGAGGRFTGPRVPDVAALQAGAGRRGVDWYRSQPAWKQAAMNVGGGLGAMALWPDFDEDQPQGRPVDSARLGVPGAYGPSPTGRSIQGGYAQRAIADRERMLENMSMLMKQGAILSFVNPKGAAEHTKRAIEIMKMDAKSRNAVEDAKIIEDVFKDGKLPKTAKTLYNRLAPKLGPAKAAEVSGYTLEIEKTEAEAAADYARSQPKLSDMYSKDAIMLSQVQAMYAQSPEAAIKQLADWMMTGVLDLSEQYTGYKPQSQADYLRMAGEILSGTGGGGVSGIGAPSGEVTNIGLS